MPVFKVTIEITALIAAPSPSSVTEQIKAMDLSALDYELRDGDMVGQHKVTAVTEVPVPQIRASLLAVGNDGSFFGDQP